MEPFLILLVAILVFFTSVSGTVVGGGGLVVVPILISLGLPVPQAIAAKRMNVTASTPVGIYKFHKEGKIMWAIGIPFILIGVAAAYVAANIVLTIDEDFLKKIIGIVILVILSIMIANKKFGLEERAKKLRKRHKVAGGVSFFFATLAGHTAGGGGGILMSYSLIFFQGLTFLKAAGTRKIAGMFSTTTSALVFIFAGVVPWDVAIPIMISGMLGTYVGAHYFIKRGDSTVRYLFMVVVVIIGIKMLFF